MPDGAAIDADKAPGTINRLRLWRRRVHPLRLRFAVAVLEHCGQRPDTFIVES
jgi:hypothetical protein